MSFMTYLLNMFTTLLAKNSLLSAYTHVPAFIDTENCPPNSPTAGLRLVGFLGITWVSVP